MPQSTLDHPRYVSSTTMSSFSTTFPMSPSIQAQPLHGADGNENKNGMIIVQNDQIYITPPLPGGKAAVISAVHPVVLKLNRMKITDPTEVTSVHHLSWEISDKPQYQITVSEDKLRAYFTLYRVEKYAWKLVNCPASAEVTLRAEPNYDLLLSKLTVEQILAGFPSSTFLPNLNIPALYAELNNPTYLPVCIAVGKAPAPGTGGVLESVLKPDMAGEFSRPESPDPGSYLDYPGITSVRAGEVLARKLPPQEGLPGFDVYGGILPSPQPEDITLSPSAEISVLPGGEIIALREGRPRITGCGTGEKCIDFPAAYLMPEAGEAEEGTFTFAGDIIAPQGIREHSIIEALVNVYICGDVCHAVIAATGSIVIRGKVTDSHVYSGYCGAKQQRLYLLPVHLMEEITALRTAARLLEENLRSRQQTVKYGLVLMLLLESKYTHIPDLLSGLQELLADKGPDYPMVTEPLKHLLEIFLHPGQFTDFLTDTVVGTLLKLLKELGNGIIELQEENARIDIAQAEDCLLYSGGDIFIHKKGVKSCTLRAGKNVHFIMGHSACSSSTVEAGGYITAQRVYTEAGRQSELIAGSKINVRQISGTRVTIGEHTAEIGNLSEDVLFTAQNLRMRNHK